MKKRLDRNFFNQPTIKVAKELLGKFLVRQIGKKKLVGKIVETEAYIGPDDKASHAAFGKTERCKPMYDKPGTAYVYFIYGMYWMLNIVTEEKGKPCAVLIRALEPVSSFGSETNLLLGFDMASRTNAGAGPPSDSKARKSSCVPESSGLPGETCAKIVPSPARVASGPGKLCQWMKIDGSFNGEDLVTSSRLYITSECPTRINTNRRRPDQLKPRIAGKRRSRIDTNEKFEIVATRRIGVDYAGVWEDKKWRFYIKGNPFVSRP